MKMEISRAWEKSEKFLSGIFDYGDEHFVPTVLFFLVLSIAVRSFFTPFDFTLGKDPYFYVMKAIAIAHGDYSPLLTHDIGWSVFLAPFFLLAGGVSVSQGIVYARVLTVVLGSLCVIPLAYIGKELLGKKGIVLFLSFYTFYPDLILSASEAIAEPLFMLLFLISIYYLIKARDDVKNILLATFFGALSYYPRFNGILLLPIIILSFYLMRKHIKGFSYKYVIYIILIFSIVSFPMLYSRYLTFGSPFDYGPNSKYFVDKYIQAWSDNIPSQTIFDYLKTHTLKDYTEKFLVHGFFLIIYLIIYTAVSPVLLFFFIYGVIVYFRKDNFIPLSTSFLIWITASIPVWSIFGSPRYLYVLIPLTLAFIVAATQDILKNNRHKNILFALLIAAFVLFSVRTTVQTMRVYTSLEPAIHDGLIWSEWVSENVKGKIALAEGWDLIMMHLPDTRQGNFKTADLYSPGSGLATIRAGYFSNLSCAMEWYKKIGVTHIGVDDNSIGNAPFLRDINPANPPTYLKEVYSNYGTDSKWKIRLYEIDWSNYDKTLTKDACAS